MAGKNLLFLTLRTFSITGGIEKVSRIAGKALYELANDRQGEAKIFSMYDKQDDIDEKYFPAKSFSGFATQKFQFIYKSIQQGKKSDVVLLSHVNLLVVGFLIKIISPKTKLVLLVHGIEVWLSFTTWKKKIFRSCDKILPVSEYTKTAMIKLNNMQPHLFTVLNNCLDPFLPAPVTTGKDLGLMNRYGLKQDNIVLMTLTRISSKEKYKGYDRVLCAMAVLIKEYPLAKYLIVGKYDAEEKFRLEQMIKIFGIENSVIFAGFIPDEELAEHYNLADVYVMPSEKEGFGIVFIEAMYYGIPVIAGNKDGSVDALYNGELGILVNPDSQTEVIDAIRKILKNTNDYLPNKDILFSKFSYDVYKQNLDQIIQGLYN